MSRPVLCAVLALVAAFAGRAAAQSTWLVSQEPCASFSDLQAAIDAASDGDTLLITRADPGWPAFVIDGKSLALIGIGEQRPVIDGGLTGRVRIRNLAAGQSVVLRGLKLDKQIRVANAAGGVWLQDLVVRGANEHKDALRVVDSDAVSLVDCSLAGRADASVGVAGSEPGIGLHATDSRVHVLDTTLRGGNGTDGTSSVWPAHAGAHGLLVDGAGFAWQLGGLARGGDGGADTCAQAGAGGHGVLVDTIFAAFWHANSTHTPGAGTPGCADDGLGLTGAGLVHTHDVGGSSVRRLAAPALMVAGQPSSLQVEGEPGEAAFLLLSSQHLPLPYPAFSGALLPGLDGLLISLGPLPGATLELPVSVAAGSIPAGLASTLHLQLITSDAGVHRAGTASTVTVTAADVQDLLDCGAGAR